MSPTNTPGPPQTAAQLAEQEETLRRDLARLAAQRKRAEDSEAERRAAEERRLQALGEARAELQRELDVVLTVVMKALPGFDQLATRIEAAVVKHGEIARELGDKWPEQQWLRHPAHRLLSWLQLFVPPKEGGR